MRAQADKKRKLQPYVQTSVAQRSSQKLGFRYFGPYKVIKQVGPVAYKLLLPADARIHPVIHVSQLKQALKPTDTVSSTLPHHYTTDKDSVQPCAVIAERFIKRGGKMVPHVKLCWQGLPTMCATWENLYAVVDAFPSPPAWGQAGALGGDIVTTHHLPGAVAYTRGARRRQAIRKAHLVAQGTAASRNAHTT